MSKIIIAGGGFAGVWAALAAAATRHRTNAGSIDITLISKEPSLCIRPRLYEGAHAEMLVPLHPLLETVGVAFAQHEISEVSATMVQTRESLAFEHDRAILAMGSHLAMPPVPGAVEHGFVVDGYKETAHLDAHLNALNVSTSGGATIVVVGASFSGLEIVTSLRDRMGPQVNLYLIDKESVAGQSLGANLVGEINQALERANVTFLGAETVKNVTANQITLSSDAKIDTLTSIFATGLHPSSVIENVGEQAKDGRLRVDAMLRVPEQPHIFAAGDVAVAQTDSNHTTLMSCQHAIPMGIVAGQNAVLNLLGEPMVNYAQPEYATCLSLGKSHAVFTQGWDRNIALTGKEGADMKTQINEAWIYPPNHELGRGAIFEAILPAKE